MADMTVERAKELISGWASSTEQEFCVGVEESNALYSELDEVLALIDSLRNVEYLRTRMLVAISFLTTEQYETFREHVADLDRRHRLAGLTEGATRRERPPQSEPFGHGAEESEGTGRVESSASEVGPANRTLDVRGMVSTIRSGGQLTASSIDDPLVRLHLAVVRYVNGLGPGDVEAEYATVVEAMRDV